ncbi:MAG: cytochrome c3 family protein [Phycisphaerae bacterium]|nr:cytochrome c3 family protein [Phycisphaerae bacterium]
MSTVFPKWTNRLPPILAGGGLTVAVAVIGLVWYYFTPKFWVVGYMPKQPDAGFNHLIHAGKLGLDCRYCHTKVEKSFTANVPNVSTCMGCHTEGRLALSTVDPNNAHNQKVAFVRQAYAEDRSIEWRRIHKVPDYVQFPHFVHVKAGVSCYSCHGMINRMDVVQHVEPMSMSWCLDCHRNPEQRLVPPDRVTQLTWVNEQLSDVHKQETDGKRLLEALRSNPLHNPPENCAACHY